MSTSSTAAKPESLEAAKAAGLRWVSDDSPGISRRKKGAKFEYFDAGAKKVTDADTILRIRALAIPPAWTDVWICPHSNGHIQAVGRDARQRKQYRYHAKWREVRDETKYGRMMDFAKALPHLRAATAKHLKLRGLPREKVLAAVVRIMEKTLIRVGNDEYAKANESFGLTTLRDKHAKIRGSKVVFDFKGKSGIKHEIDFEDKRLADIVQKCQDLPGYELFQYLDENGQVKDVGSTDVNDYIREITGQDFTAKDFRTWAGTVLAARALQEIEAFDSKAAAKRNIKRAIETVAKKLGNTVTVCRKCYVHPAVVDSYLDGTLAKNLSRKAGKALARSNGKLPPEEAAILGLLQVRLAKDAVKTNGFSKRKRASS
jgi:DNA topoisomerase-1